jgi:hypothetical protein
MAQRIIKGGLAGLAAAATVLAGCANQEQRAIYSEIYDSARASGGKTERIGASDWTQRDINRDGIIDEKLNGQNLRVRVAGDQDIGASITLKYSPDGRNFKVVGTSDTKGNPLKKLYYNLEVGAKGYDVSDDKGQLFQRIINSKGYIITESYQNGKLVNSVTKDRKNKIVQEIRWNPGTHEYDIKFN